MRKIVAVLVALFFNTAIYAKEIVEVVWWAGPAGGPANIMRETINEANNLQQKYHFVFEHKPGAGGAVALAYVKSRSSTGQLTLLSGGDAFLARQNLFKDGVYNSSEWNMILPQVTIPQAIAASKKATFASLLNKKSVTVGVGGLGTNQHLIAEQLKQFFPEVVIVPHSKFDQVQQLIGGHIDFAVDWASSLSQFDQLEIVGITGRKSFTGFPTLNTKNFKNMEKFSSRIWLLSPATLPEKQFVEINEILVAAQNNSNKIKEIVEKEMAQLLLINRKDYSKWMEEAEDEVKFRTKNITIK